MRSAYFYLRGGGATPADAAPYFLKLTLSKSGSSSTTTTSSDYQLTIPSAFTITQSGWNEITEGITAKVSGDNVKFDSGYRLTVTAATDGTLTADGITDTITYTLKAVSTDTAATTAWEFTAADLNASDDTGAITGTTKTLGVDVEDYSTKPNGDYSDTITFTARVAKLTTLADALVNGGTITISFIDGFDGSSATFTYNNGTFSETHSGWFIEGARMSIKDGNLVAEICDDESWSETEINTITLNPVDNTWTLTQPGGTYDTSNYTFAVNGVDITSQLTQQ